VGRNSIKFATNSRQGYSRTQLNLSFYAGGYLWRKNPKNLTLQKKNLNPSHSTAHLSCIFRSATSQNKAKIKSRRMPIASLFGQLDKTIIISMLRIPNFLYKNKIFGPNKSVTNNHAPCKNIIFLLMLSRKSDNRDQHARNEWTAQKWRTSKFNWTLPFRAPPLTRRF
jgi:hypothetical protein